MLLKKILRRLEYFWWIKIKHDVVGYARKLGVNIGSGCTILGNPLTTFGSEPYLITIGDNVEVVGDVRFITHEGGLWCVRNLYSEYKNFDIFRPIVIGNNVMLGIGSVIMPGVHVGNNCIIGARSLVTRSIPDNTIVAGVPAKQISTLDQFKEKFNKEDLFPTKPMTAEEKKKYIMKTKPEWFK